MRKRKRPSESDESYERSFAVSCWGIGQAKTQEFRERVTDYNRCDTGWSENETMRLHNHVSLLLNTLGFHVFNQSVTFYRGGGIVLLSRRDGLGGEGTESRRCNVSRACLCARKRLTVLVLMLPWIYLLSSG